MNNKLVRDLASVTETLTAPAVVELTDGEISKVAGGLLLAEEMLDGK
jgi:hypothetical protein